jgi:hypothetical protein
MQNKKGRAKWGRRYPMGGFEEETLSASAQSLSFSNISLTSWDANFVDPIVSKQHRFMA